MSSDMAMAVKARAMFGARMKEADYNALMQKKSVPEVAAALKRGPVFSEILAGVNEKAVHTGQLEALVRMDVYRRLQKLLRYSEGDYGKFIYAAVETEEIDLILSSIRWFTQKDAEARSAMIADMPIYISHYLCFDVKKLPEVTNFDDLIKILKGTRYERIVRKYETKDFSQINYIGLEHELMQNYYETVMDVVSGYGRAGIDMMAIVKARIELDNIAMIYRLKKYFRAAPDQIRPMITHTTYLFNDREMEDLISSSTADQVIEKMQKKYHRYVKNVKFSSIEHYTGMIRYHMNYHFLENSTEPKLVLLSYLLLSRIEIQNVVNIIEGVSYGIGADHMKPMLVY